MSGFPTGTISYKKNGRARIKVAGGWRNHARWLMEQYLGRRLLTKELCHHKDGSVDNDVIDNLQLMSKSAHFRLHNTGEGNPNWDKHLALTHRVRIATALLGRHHSEEAKAKMRLRTGEKNPNWRGDSAGPAAIRRRKRIARG